MKILVTSVQDLLVQLSSAILFKYQQPRVLNIDKLTYAGNLESLKKSINAPSYEFKQIDICDTEQITAAIDAFQPNAIMHLAEVACRPLN